MISGILFKKENLWLISYFGPKEDSDTIREIELHPDFIESVEKSCNYWNGKQIFFNPVWLKNDKSGFWCALPAHKL